MKATRHAERRRTSHFARSNATRYAERRRTHFARKATRYAERGRQWHLTSSVIICTSRGAQS